MDWTISWWAWVLLGLALALLELTTPGGFYFIFFGIAAVCVGALSWAGLISETWLQFMVFSILAIVASLLFRRPLMQRFGPKAPEIPVDTLVGETAMALDDIEIDGFGKVELRGSAWNARNSGGQKVMRGQRCTVDRVDGLLLWVKG